jgi:hypothetical protein
MYNEVFSLNLVLKCVRLSYFHLWNSEPDCTKLLHCKPDPVKPAVMCRQMRKHSVVEFNWDSLLIGLNPSSNILRFTTFWKVVLFLSSGKETLCGPHRLIYSQSLGTTETVNLYRYTPENSSSPYNRKMAIEKLKSDYKTQK